MKEDKVMKELRSIRDRASKRHLSMTREERLAESKEALDWFLNEIGESKANFTIERDKGRKTVDYPISSEFEPSYVSEESPLYLAEKED